MSWRKRQKLPPTIQVHLVADKMVEVFPRRLSIDQKILVQHALHKDKRKQKYTISLTEALPLQKLAMDNRWDYNGVPVLILQLLDELKQRKLDDFATDDKPDFLTLWHQLHAHQKTGVLEIIQYFKGRVLLGDEMGLGKTHQGVAVVLYYKEEGRTLIVCPSYLRYHWESSLVDLGGVSPDDITVVKKATDTPTAAFVIVSYDLVAREDCGVTGHFNTLLCDESHYLKNRKAKRTLKVLKISKNCKRVMLMTGTPATNRPIELFSQMHMIRPAFVKYSTHFAKRYCDGKMTDFGYDERGHSCDEELHWLLKKVYMVRRLKRDVLHLPKKTRQKVVLAVDDCASTRLLQEGFKRWKAINQSLVHTTDSAIKQRKNHERKRLVSEMFRQTAKAKTKAMQAWLKDFIDSDHTFLFFAYHMDTLDAMESICSGKEYIRIDGKTNADKRQEYVQKFQNGGAKIALLSIMAAGTGLTLTAAQTVVFGELYWVPGVMLQCEDRVHRISQQKPVTIYHLLGKNTLDDHIYKQLIVKLKTLDTLVDQRGDRTLEGESDEFIFN